MTSRTSWFRLVHDAMNANDAVKFYNVFKYPDGAKCLYISDVSPQGNAWGKFVVKGNSYKAIYQKLIKANITADLLSANRMHETPDL